MQCNPPLLLHVWLHRTIFAAVPCHVADPVSANTIVRYPGVSRRRICTLGLTASKGRHSVSSGTRGIRDSNPPDSVPALILGGPKLAALLGIIVGFSPLSREAGFIPLQSSARPVRWSTYVLFVASHCK
jgi:hypothetical protein